MGRAPCCEKMGLKKGPWSTEEDRILIAHIQKHGHPNWRALPKQAGLSRCGKSCRLRWINYLRPDIKRGNFSKEEEEAIVNLHDELGNKWSLIAATLPGRTDNEIKNVWHTYLKKRAAAKMNKNKNKNKKNNNENNSDEKPNPNVKTNRTDRFEESAVSSTPQPSCSDLSSSPSVSTGETDVRRDHHQCRNMDATTTTTTKDEDQIVDSLPFDENDFPEIDESFWADALSENNCSSSSSGGGILTSDFGVNEFCTFHDNGGMDFWYNVLLTAGGDVQYNQTLTIFSTEQ